ncbi:hypothetical protein V1509DRAFT_635536 [Lipomyces kononenkoae]
MVTTSAVVRSSEISRTHTSASPRPALGDMPVNTWLGVACAEHVRRGKVEGIMQVCHGKEAQLHRIRPGDRIIYYSPTVSMGEKTISAPDCNWYCHGRTRIVPTWVTIFALGGAMSCG